MMFTFLLDNSSFHEIIKDPDATNTFIKKLKASRHRVVVSIDTITENFEGKSEYVIKRMPNLKRIIDSVSVQQFVVAKSIRSWLQNELKHNGRLNNVPALKSSSRWTGFLNFLTDIPGFIEFHQQLEPSRDEGAKVRKRLLESDRVFRAKAKELIGTKEVVSYLNTFKADSRNSHQLLFANTLDLSRRLGREILNAGDGQYKIHRTYLMCLYLRSLGNALDDFNRHPEFSFLNRIREGNWFDLAIIAQASQFDYLVSDDIDQRGICNFLKEKRIFRAEAIDLKGFLEKI